MVLRRLLNGRTVYDVDEYIKPGNLKMISDAAKGSKHLVLELAWTTRRRLCLGADESSGGVHLILFEVPAWASPSIWLDGSASCSRCSWVMLVQWGQWLYEQACQDRLQHHAIHRHNWHAFGYVFGYLIIAVWWSFTSSSRSAGMGVVFNGPLV